jgi:hypothetical protein
VGEIKIERERERESKKRKRERSDIELYDNQQFVNLRSERQLNLLSVTSLSWSIFKNIYRTYSMMKQKFIIGK